MKSETLKALRDEFAKIKRKRDSLVEQLNQSTKEYEALQQTIQVFSGETTQDEKQLFIENTTGKKKPTEAVRELIEKNPTKEWKPGEVSKHLVELHKQGFLLTKSVTLENAGHYIFNNLLKQGYVEIVSKDPLLYRKNIKSGLGS